MRAIDVALAAGLPPRLAYTIEETAAYSGFQESELRKAVKRGWLMALKPRGATRPLYIEPEELERYMREEMTAWRSEEA